MKILAKAFLALLISFVTLQFVFFSNTNKITEVNIISAEYEATCNRLGNELAFFLGIEVIGENTTFQDIEVSMIKTNNSLKEDKAKCVFYSEYFQYYCKFTPSEEGNFYPSMAQDIQTDFYVIHSFALKNYLIGATNKEIILPKENLTRSVIYFYEEAYEQDIKYEFKSELKEELKPEVEIDDEKLDCHIDDKDKKFLICKVDMHRFRMRQASFDGIVKNVCGLKAADALLFTWMKYPIGFLNALYFREEQPQVKCVNSMPKGTTLTFWSISDPLFEDGDLHMDGKVKFIDKEDPSKIINTNCTVNKTKGFTCTTIEDATQDGHYQGILKENYTWTSEEADFGVGAFGTSNTLNYNKNYNPCVTKTLKITHDYRQAISQTFNVEFENDLTEAYPVVFGETKLPCTISGKIQTCTFNRTLLPPVRETNYIEYVGELQNICGTMELNITISVKETALPRVVVKSAIYEETCNQMTKGDKLKFYLNATFPDETIKDLDQFEIEMIPKRGEQNEKAICLRTDYSDVQCECEFTSEIGDNTFYPYLHKKIKTDKYVIEPFKLIESEVGITQNEIIKPSSSQYKFKVYYDYSKLDYDLSFEFNGELSDTTKSGLILDNEEVPCKVNEENKKELICTINSLDYLLAYKTYEGNLINICGLKDSSVKLDTYQKEQKKVQETLRFDYTNPEEQCVDKITSGTQISFFTIRAGSFSEEIKVEGVKFVNDKDETKTYETSCVNFGMFFNCTPTIDMTVDGYYRGIMKNQYYVKRNDFDILYLPFTTMNTINVNSKYIPISDKSAIAIKHNYKDSEIGTFNITYEKELTEPFPVYFYVLNINLTCTVSGNIQTCTFTKKEIPPIRSDDYVSHIGMILNACGTKEAYITLMVKETGDPVEITVTKPSFKNLTILPLEDYTKNLLFDVFYEAKGKLQKDYSFSKLTLSTDDLYTKMYLGCKTKFKENKFNCTYRSPIKQGLYHLYLAEDYHDEDYVVYKLSGEDKIGFISSYTKPVNESLNVFQDYTNTSEGNFTIQFEKWLGQYRPYVEISGNQIDCDTRGNKLECEFNETMFPHTNGTTTEYKGMLFNSLGISEMDLTLTVTKESPPISSVGFISFSKIFMLIICLILF
ncbi:MAG: hypothetical protein MJ252_12975 [archaeon]|nr:hypothetical protein [archaeon]